MTGRTYLVGRECEFLTTGSQAEARLVYPA